MYSFLRTGFDMTRAMPAFLILLCCSISQSVYAGTGTVTVTTSYQGNWLVYENSSDVNISNCPLGAESDLKNCVDTAAAAQHISIASPWFSSDSYGNACSVAGEIVSDVLECNGESFTESSGTFPLYVGMECLNGGSPHPTLGENQGAGPIPGWCLVLGVAPPPAAPVCADGNPIPSGQQNCANSAGQNAGPPEKPQGAGDPINVGSGNVYLEATDFKTPGQFPLVFKRAYNSGIANETSNPDAADDSMGPGWTTNITGPHLYVNVDQQFYTCTDQSTGNQYICPTVTSPVLVTVWREDGRQSVFSGQITTAGPPTSESLAPQPGAIGQLTYGVLPAPLLGYGYDYLSDGGDSEFFSDSGVLLMIQNPHGGQLIYSYNGSGKVTSVVDTSMAYGPNIEYLTLNITYDSLGRISTVTNTIQGQSSGGGTYTYTYDGNGNLHTATYPDNSMVQYVYEDSVHIHALTGIIDENGSRYATWTYDTQGRAISSQHAGGVDNFTVNGYTTDGSGNISQALITEPTGLQRTLTFTTINGRTLLTSASALCTECGDKSQYISYDSNGFVNSKTNFNGNTTLYTHDSAGHELTRVEAAGTPVQRTITTTWNGSLNLPKTVTTSNAANQPLFETSYCYNSTTGCIDTQGPGSVWTKTITDLSTNISRTTTYTFITNYGFLTSPISGPRGLLQSIKGPRTDVQQMTTLGYSFNGFFMPNPSMITPQAGDALANGNQNIAGLLTAFQDSNQQSTSLSYDVRQRLTGITKNNMNVTGAQSPCFTCNILHETTQYSYDAAGEFTKIIRPSGGYVQYGYDAAHRLTSIINSAGEKIVYTLDSLGNRTNEQTYNSSGTLVRSHQRVYDNLNHLIQDIGGAGQVTAYTYDSDGNVLTITDPLQHVTTRTYDALDRLATSRDAVGGVTQYTLDSFDRVTIVVDPRNLATDYHRDAFGDVVELDSPDTGRTTSSYDLAGNRTSQTDSRGIVTNYNYDAINRLIGKSYPLYAAQNVTWIYDQGVCGKFSTSSNYINGMPPSPITGSIGHLICMTDPSGTTAYTQYDGYGNLQIARSPKETLAYWYDVDNNISQVNFVPTSNINNVYVSSNPDVAYHRDALDRVSEVDAQYWNSTSGQSVTYALAHNITYEPFGPITGLQYGNGLAESRTFDGDYRPLTIAIPAVMGLTYTPDADGNITAVTDSVRAAGLSFGQSLTYDPMDRLVSWTGSYSNVSSLAFGYDAAGNRTYRTANNSYTSTYNYSSGNNELSSITGSGAMTYTYDLAGNISGDGTNQYVHGVLGQIVQIINTSTNTTIAQYAFNGLDQRAVKVTGGVTHYFVYDQSGHLLDELNSDGSIYGSYVWLGDRLLATFSGPVSASSNAFYIHVDALNTPRVMTNLSQAIGWMWQSGPFGEGGQSPLSFGGSFRPRMAGQFYDAEDAKHYNYFRNYDPVTGRYMESDPIGLGGGINTYAYVKNNPLRFSDPFGLCGQKPQQPQTAPDPNKYSVSDCIRRYLTDTYGESYANFVKENSFIGPDRTEAMNDAAGDEVRNKAIEAGADYFLDVDLGPLGWAALGGDAARAIKASGLYLEAHNACY